MGLYIGSFLLGLLLGCLITRQYDKAQAVKRKRRRPAIPDSLRLPADDSVGQMAAYGDRKPEHHPSQKKETIGEDRKVPPVEDAPKPYKRIPEGKEGTASSVLDPLPAFNPSARKATAADVKRKRTEELYRSFQTVDTLELVFQYSFPGNHMFQKGSGYLHNSQREVLPEKKVFSQTDSAKGYAMNGLFWVFDVIYEGKKYTFDQIMEDALGSDYIRIVAVLECARIQEAASPGRYYLEKRGTLEIATYEGTRQS